MPVKAVLLSQLQTKHKNCAGFENLTNFNKAELIKADTNLVGANKDYVARAKGVVQVRKTKLTQKKVIKELKLKISDAKYKVMVALADALSKTQKQRAGVITEFEAGIRAIGKGSTAKGQELLMNAKKVADENSFERKQALYNALIKTLDNIVERSKPEKL